MLCSKWNRIESKISEAIINNETNHEDLMTIINEENKYRELKERIKIMNSQRSGTEKNNLIEESKKLSVNEVTKSSKITKNNF